MAGREPLRRTAALVTVLLVGLLLTLAWVVWRFVTEGEQRDAVHVFQYCVLLVLAALAGALIAPRSHWPLLATAALGTLLPWLGLGAGVCAVVVAAGSLAAAGYALLTRSRPAAVTAVLGVLVSLLGLLLIL